MLSARTWLLKGVIICGGENIYRREIEGVLVMHSHVGDAALADVTAPLPHKLWWPISASLSTRSFTNKRSMSIAMRF